ncbi:MAG TPA: bifunctional phosphopantothenoylcysteine decarboxylase/phosphopantothenate--cysteine ligase CoaBC [Terriglobales bacterium]|nr:bifunctional phosphopantothenoylcysteine decarboxylase/phosphopantothenate--cysteine ligase CoaBC [Terriglobales bacterium]
MNIALGVTGGIAAYKAAEVLRLLQDRGVRSQVIMTRAAQEFVRPLTFAALSGQKVITEMFSSDYGGQANLDSAVEHISVAESIQALVVVPATADIIAKFANGVADDFLSTLYLATTAPVVVAPAMNVNMWNHPATQANLEVLRKRGVRIVEPGSGYLACGMIGAGRLAANENIVEAVLDVLQTTKDLVGETVLVTAGPTREPIDPVRYISNRSSGKMGYALAEEASRRGAKVILVSGPVSLNPPVNVEIVRVETAKEMRDAVFARKDEASVIIKSAAVADYTPAKPEGKKMKRHDAFSLDLTPTDDIATLLSKRRDGQLLIGFAAETNDVLEHARQKMLKKRMDAIVANDVSRKDIGFDSDQNAVTIITATDVQEIPVTSKREVAGRILDTVKALRQRTPAAAKKNA